MLRKNFPSRQKKRNEEALVRQTEREKRSNIAQLKSIDARLGNNVGAKKERDKLRFAMLLGK